MDNGKEICLTREELNAKKMEVLARFAAIASHDLKNPLAGLKNIAYYFTKAIKIEGETPNKMLKMLSDTVDRMDAMIVSILDSTRVKQLHKLPCDIGVIINALADKFKNDKVSFKLNIPAGVTANADPDRIKQVFSEIFSNAEDAISGESVEISVSLSAQNGIITAVITDNGTGMNEETLSNAFDPMFSTKAAKSLGMGLAVAKQLAIMHGGNITATSKPSQGSVFTVTLSQN
ncbi:MAG: HAMP domain-containing histidine kinase [Elusimicrobia bacterium]|nr:HAMP domain-containing histidine kinase [Elusimicrobiota bacterium]